MRLKRILLVSVVSMICLSAWASPKPPGTLESNPPSRAEAIFAGGCFWCMEPPFDKTEGVISTLSGYTGGHQKDPSYKQVSGGGTGHYEAIKIIYDPRQVTYPQLLEIFWHNVDPLDDRGQFCDKGQQYLSAIFPQDKIQQKQAETSLNALAESGTLKGKIATKIIPASEFYEAED